MKPWLFFIIVLNIFLFPKTSFSQRKPILKKSETYYQEALKKLSTNSIDEAITLYRKAIATDTTNVYAYQSLADLYRKNANYKEAIPLYLKVLKIDSTLTNLTYFGLGESLANSAKYNEAIPYLLRYSKNVHDSNSKNNTKRLLDNCYFSITYSNNYHTTLQTLPTEINSSFDEYFPKFTANDKNIIFTRKVDNRESFYESELENGKWKTAEKLKGFVNSSNFNEGAHCISPDGKFLFFTGCNRPDGLGSCDIYISKFENGNWSTPFNIGAPINTRGWESQPAISADGKTLYFVSNRNGGFGGTDIWKSELDVDGNWSKPINLGANINTVFDESAPFIHPDNKSLYFSSDGWPGFGQQDLFKSQLDTNSNWSVPENLGKPINNEFNQTSIHISMDGANGFLSSQDSTLQLDIYSFILPDHVKPTPVAFINGTLHDAKDHKPLQAKILVTDIINKKTVFEDISDHLDGKFLATLLLGSNYALHIKKKGYLFFSKQYDMTDSTLRSKSFEQNILLYPIQKGAKTQLNNIYFEIDKHDLLAASLTELKILLEFMKVNNYVKIEISGHTDNTGNSVHNKVLSEKRAHAVQQYLISNGIAKERLVIIGKGDTLPMADNTTIDGRQLNRRTEIMILN